MTPPPRPAPPRLRSRSRLALGAAFIAAAALATGIVLVGRSQGRWIDPVHAEGSADKIQLAVVARGFEQVTDIQFVPGLPDRAFVLSKTGKAWLVAIPARGKEPVRADASPKVFEVEVRTSSELGLLGVAFSPKYEQNGLFYLNYNPEDGERRTRIAEWKLPQERLGKEPAREQRVVLEVAQPYSNHNGGQLQFGPDGMLFIGLGDGGAGGDPQGHGQNLGSLLGKMLRIDVSRTEGKLGYAVPKDNPFVGKAGARPEIWAYGLRNPWRYSFDPKGRLVAADVGQNAYEEVDIVERGQNLGWARREGRHCYPEDAKCSAQGLVEPIFEYPRSEGLSVTGGYVYSGKSVEALKNKYVFADFVTGRVWAMDLPPTAGSAAKAEIVATVQRTISTFGRDAAGEVYAGDFSSGELLRLTPRR